jgi:subtilisin family serine protease
MKKILSLTLFFAIASFVSAQSRYLVYFNNKGNVANLNIEDVLSQRAIKNHIKNNVAINELDFPINIDYLKEIKKIGEVVKKSKWLNAVVLKSNSSAQSILALPFVSKVEVLATGKVIKDNKFDQLDQLNNLKTLPYDSTLQQNSQIGVDCIHDRGFLGENVLLAVIDAGFEGMDTIMAFDSLYLQNRVIDKYDFIDNDTLVYEKHFHGTWVSSVIAGNQVNYIGSAPHVDLCLYITEDVTREVHEEEFDLVRGLERADSVGADLVNISLGYFAFDTLQGDYVYPDMDGHTTISALGAQIAASKGLLIVTSAGNSGPDYIGTPCDADSILCVGATDTNSIKASFSSVGPAADGRIKPDVSAIGQRAFCVDTDGTIRTCNGTSFASPLTCGMVACLIQAHPTLTMMDIISSVQQSASQFLSPDSLLGYGIPNACKADSLLDLLEIVTDINEVNEIDNVNIFPNPTNSYITISSKEQIKNVQFISVEGRLVKQFTFGGSNSVLINCNDLVKGVYLIRINNSNYKQLVKY